MEHELVDGSRFPNITAATSACVVCDKTITADQTSVTVLTTQGWGHVHKVCHETWVSWNR